MTRRRSLRVRLLSLTVVGGLAIAGIAVPVVFAHASDAPITTDDAGVVTQPVGAIAFGGTSTGNPGSVTTFVDDFDGAAGTVADPSRWTYQTGGNWGGGAERQQYTNRASNASLTGDGSLLITARGEMYTGSDKITRQYTSARLISKQSVLYGSVQARIRMSGAPGAWPAFWMMGANYAQVRWPACGEIDVMESTNRLSALYGSIHGPVLGAAKGTAYNQGRGFLPPGGLADAWHVYGVEWSPTAVKFLLDGVPFVTVNRLAMPATQLWAIDNPQNIVLNIAVGGMAGTPAPPAAFNATMEVDWVKASVL